MVVSAAARSRVLSLAKANSMGVQVGRVRGQEAQRCAAFADQVIHLIALVSGQVVHDDDVARLEGRAQHLIDVDEEGLAVHRAVQHERRGQAVATQAGGEGGGLPVAERLAAEGASAPGCATVSADHLGVGARLVDEDQPGRIKIWLAGLPGGARFGHVGPRLLAGVQGFF